jgi:hypothetical protein
MLFILPATALHNVGTVNIYSGQSYYFDEVALYNNACQGAYGQNYYAASNALCWRYCLEGNCALPIRGQSIACGIYGGVTFNNAVQVLRTTWTVAGMCENTGNLYANYPNKDYNINVTFWEDGYFPTNTSNITVNVKNLANTNLQNINVRIQTDVDDQQYTTDINGLITLGLSYSNISAVLTTTATGYYNAYSENFNIVSASMNKTIYLTQNSDGVIERNITYSVRNNLYAPVSGAFVTHTISAQSSTDGYTDENGNITFIQLPVFNNASYVIVTKSGYQDYASFFAFTSDMVKNITLYPLSITPTPLPTQVPPSQLIYTNITYYVKTLSGIPIQNVQIELFYHNQEFSSWHGLTDANGLYTFNNIEHYINEEFDLRFTKSGYNVNNYIGVTYPNVANIDYTYYMAPLISPTPTPVFYDTLTLTAVPNSISLGSSATLTATSSNATKLTYAGGLRTTLFYENDNLGSYSSFRLIGAYTNVNATYWKFRTNNSAAWGTPSTASPLSLVVTPATGGEYTYQFAAFDISSISIGTANTNLVIAGGGSAAGLVMNLFAYDGSTTSHLMNYTLSLTDDNTGFMQDYGYINYDKNVNLGRGNSYTLSATKEGYVSGSKQFICPISLDIVMGDFGAMIGVPLFPTGTISVGNTTVTVHVDDQETYYPIPNVQISMTGFLTPKFTGVSGESVSFILPQNFQFTTIAAKNGYCTVSETKNTSTNSYMYVDLYMKFGACLGVTPTHTPIPNATPVIPIPTPVGGYGQLNGTATVCNNNMPSNASFIDKYIKNPIACAGITDLVSQNLIIAVLIIFICGIIAAKYAGAIGFAIGAVLGAIVAMAVGLIPFWFIIILVLISIAILAIKIFFSNSG